MAARQYTIAVGPRPCWSARPKFGSSPWFFSSADPLRPAQDALWAEQQDDDQHGQGADVLELRRDESGHLDEQADDEAADEGPQMVPRPPSTTAAKISSRILKPNW